MRCTYQAYVAHVAGWLFFWLQENFTVSQILVSINTAIQLFAVARLPSLSSSSPSLLFITHLVAKTFAGIGVLDFIDNSGVALVSTFSNTSIRLCSIYDIASCRTSINGSSSLDICAVPACGCRIEAPVRYDSCIRPRGHLFWPAGRYWWRGMVHARWVDRTRSRRHRRLQRRHGGLVVLVDSTCNSLDSIV